MNKILDKALVFAKNAHEGQKRKYTGEDYINHPIRVMQLVSTKTKDSHALVTALLHDVVEDTDITFKDIYDSFGYRIMKNVYYLTDCNHGIGNRKTRKMIDNIRLSDAPSIVQTIKYADLIDNTSSILKYDPKFAKTYLQEKQILLSLINKGNIELYKMALDLAHQEIK